MCSFEMAAIWLKKKILLHIDQWPPQQPHAPTYVFAQIDFLFVVLKIAWTQEMPFAIDAELVDMHSDERIWDHHRYRFGWAKRDHARPYEFHFVFFFLWTLDESFTVQWSAKNATNAHSNHSIFCCRISNRMSFGITHFLLANSPKPRSTASAPM